MKFWDSSALFALVAAEAGSGELARLLEEDPAGAMWFFTPLEVRSALARRRRTGSLDAATAQKIWDRFSRVRSSLFEVDAFLPVREKTQRFLDLHGLRAGDAVQLAAGIVAAEGRPEFFPFVTLDRRLAEAAAKGGFPVLPPLSGEGRVADRPAPLRRRPRRARGPRRRRIAARIPL